MYLTAILIAASGICTAIARRMARARDWSPGLWGFFAAFLGPLPLAVMILTPAHRDEDA